MLETKMGHCDFLSKGLEDKGAGLDEQTLLQSSVGSMGQFRLGSFGLNWATNLLCGDFCFHT